MSTHRHASKGFLLLIPLLVAVLLRVGPLASVPVFLFRPNLTGSLAASGFPTCPVCEAPIESEEMARIVLEDGSAIHFDTPDDMFRYLRHRRRYGGDKLDLEIEGMYVSNFFDKQSIPARGAHFVVCDDLSIMDSRLVALRTRMELAAFLREHQGDRVLHFAEIMEEGLPAVL